VAERVGRRPPSPSLSRLRRGEIPGIRHDSNPYGTIVLVVLGLVGCLIWRANAVGLEQLAVFGGMDELRHHWWRVVTAPFTYDNTGYAFVALSIVALYGTLVERRHGPVSVIALFLAGGVGGTALTAQAGPDVVLGGNGAALALLTAWAMQDLLALRAGQDYDGDLVGTGVLAVVVALMPLAAPHASWISGAVGVAAGALVGYPLARIHPA
jgi:membrane associated rhomboid family serine protease